MKYTITHRTHFQYNDSVPLCHNIVRLRPRETFRQTLLSCEIGVDPTPAVLKDGVDFFGNDVAWFSLQEPHDSLAITSRSEVELTPIETTKPFPRAWDEVTSELSRRLEPDVLYARQFGFDSPHIARAQALRDYAEPSFTPGRPLYDGVFELMRRIFTDVKFVPGVTAVGTPVLEVLQNRQGVCQDFAHLMIGCLRSMNLAARYISGYLVTRPTPGQSRLIGADASHAWVSVFFPDFGWIDFDPTNDMLPDQRHITLAWGRDYDDVSPVKGVIIGGYQHAMKVSVDVRPEPDAL